VHLTCALRRWILRPSPFDSALSGPFHEISDSCFCLWKFRVPQFPSGDVLFRSRLPPSRALSSGIYTFTSASLV